MGFARRPWFPVLISGLALFFAAEQVLKVTENICPHGDFEINSALARVLCTLPDSQRKE
jgi:hypothetical protein